MTESQWRTLIEDFVAGRIGGPEFERRFLEARRDEVARGISQSYAVDLLFYEVDAYCADPGLIGPHDIDEHQLREEARRCIERWTEPWPTMPSA